MWEKNESAPASFEQYIHIDKKKLTFQVGLFLMKSTFTVLIQIEDKGLNEDI